MLIFLYHLCFLVQRRVLDRLSLEDTETNGRDWDIVACFGTYISADETIYDLFGNFEAQGRKRVCEKLGSGDLSLAGEERSSEGVSKFYSVT